MLMIGFLVGLAAYVVVAQEDKTAASLAEEIKSEVEEKGFVLE